MRQKRLADPNKIAMFKTLQGTFSTKFLLVEIFDYTEEEAVEIVRETREEMLSNEQRLVEKEIQERLGV